MLAVLLKSYLVANLDAVYHQTLTAHVKLNGKSHTLKHDTAAIKKQYIFTQQMGGTKHIDIVGSSWGSIADKSS